MIDHRRQILAQMIKLLAFGDIAQDPLDGIGFIELDATRVHLDRRMRIILAPQGRFVGKRLIFAQGYGRAPDYEAVGMRVFFFLALFAANASAQSLPDGPGKDVFVSVCSLSLV